MSPYPYTGSRYPVAPSQGYAPAGVVYRSPPPKRPKLYTAPTTGYAPGGVSYKPIPPAQRVPGGPALAGSGQPPAATTPTHTAPPYGGGATGPAFGSDPIYQQVMALANQDVANAEDAARAAREQAIVQFGDPGLANTKAFQLGQKWADAAQANPFSTLKNLLRGHLANVQQIEQNMNRSNLWSSSTRTRANQQEQTGYLGQIAGETSKTQGVLADILSQLLSAKSLAEQRRTDAAADAYARWIEAGKGADSGQTDTTPAITPGTHPTTTPPKKKTHAVVKLYTPPTAGYAPGGVSYKPIPKKHRIHYGR